MTSFQKLQEKGVVNSCNGQLLGTVCDFQIDECSGKVCAIVIPGHSRFFGLLKGERDYVIPWNRILKIGRDVILVDVDENCLHRFD